MPYLTLAERAAFERYVSLALNGSARAHDVCEAMVAIFGKKLRPVELHELTMARWSVLSGGSPRARFYRMVARIRMRNASEEPTRD